MQLRPGYRVAVAPNFHLPIDWTERLHVNGGAEQSAHRYWSRQDWRPPTTEEMTILVDGESEDRLDVFRLADHFISRWWQLLSEMEAPGANPTAFHDYIAEVCRFLRFKNLPLPKEAECALVASRPGQRSLDWNAASSGDNGLAFDLAPSIRWRQEMVSSPRLWGGINLGDEPMSLVFLNLTPLQMSEALIETRSESDTESVVPLGIQFLGSFSDYPLVKLRLEPGEGYRLPIGVLGEHSTVDKSEPSLVLRLRSV